MTPRDFIYWLQGFFEISGAAELNAAQVRMVRNHINLVFKETLDLPDPDGSSQDVHDGITRNNKVREAATIERLRQYQPGQKC